MSRLSRVAQNIIAPALHSHRASSFNALAPCITLNHKYRFDYHQNSNYPYFRPLLAFGTGLALSAQYVAQQSPAKCDIVDNRKFGKMVESKIAEALRKNKGPVTLQKRMKHNGPPVEGAKSNYRVFDIVINKTGHLHEVKSGYVANNKHIREQIAKDAQFVQDGKNVTWHNRKGCTGKRGIASKIRDLLEDNGITLCKCADTDPCTESKAMPNKINSPSATTKEFKTLSRDKEQITSVGTPAKKMQSSSVDKVQNSSSAQKIQKVTSQAKMLKTAGVVNLAVAILCLGAACYMRHQINNISKEMPQLEKECDAILHKIDDIEHLLDDIIVLSNDELLQLNIQPIEKNMMALKTRINKFDDKCKKIIRKSEKGEKASAVVGFVSLCTVIVGIGVTVASCGADCGAGAAMGLGSIGIGGTATVLSMDNFERHTGIIQTVNGVLDKVFSGKATVDKKYQLLMDLLS